jgi:hypothetical protein
MSVAKVAQSQTLLRTTRQWLEAIIASTRLRFVAAGMRRRIDAVMPYGEVFLRTVDRLIGNFRRRKSLAVVVGVAGSVLFLILLLEISVRIELSKEAGSAAIDATAAPSASEQKMDLGHVLTLQPTNSSWLHSADQEAATGALPSLGPKRSDKSFKSRYLCRALVPPAERDLHIQNGQPTCCANGNSSAVRTMPIHASS